MNVPLQDTCFDLWKQKYQLHDDIGNPIDASPEDSLKRVAKFLASGEKEPEKWEKLFFETLNRGALPAGRIMSNGGAWKWKPATSLINCTVSKTIEDSMLGIVDALKEAGLTLAAGCGIGYEFSTLRPSGAYVNGAGADTSGPLTFMDIYNTLCKTVSSAGGRRGAMMGTFAVWHPDVEDFIRAKRENGRLRQFNLSLLIDDEFMQAVDSDLEWDLVFPMKHRDFKLSEGKEIRTVKKVRFWEEDYCKKQDYVLAENDTIVCKVYKTIRARELWDAIMLSTYDYSEPGFLLIDRINAYNNLYFVEKIRASNPCQPAWAKVLTPEGIRELKDIDIGSKIWSKEGWTKVVNKWSTGVKPVYRYTTTRGTFYGTENHKVVANGEKVEARYAEYIDSIAGPYEVSDISVDPQDIMDGLVIGDGSVHKASNNLIYLYIGKEDTDYFSSEISEYITKYRPGLTSQETGYEIKTTILSQELPYTYNRRVPSRYITNKPKMIGFLRGLYSANGSVVNNRITLKSASKGLIEDVQLMLSSIGITSYVTTNKPTSIKFSNGEYLCRESYDLNITTDREKFVNTIGFIQKYKMDKIKKTNYSCPPRNLTADIKEVSLISEEEVFDITVDNSSHTYWTQGCDVSNCGEQPLPPHGACLLGSLVVAYYIKHPLTPEQYFDWEEYRKDVRIFSRILDNVVEHNGLPLPEQIREIEYKRRHGKGLTGIGSALNILGMPYGSPESLQFIEELFKILALESYREGILLAKEKGPAPIFYDETGGVSNTALWVNSKYLEEAVWSQEPSLKGEALKYGCRYTHATSIAPTGTLSATFGNNVSNGIEPTFSHGYTRNVIKQGKKAKVACKVYSYEALLWNQVHNNDELPKTWSTSDTLSPIDHINVQAIAQKYVDSAVSKTVNVPVNIPFEEFKDVYMQAYKAGLKGCTTFRFNPDVFSGVLVKDVDLEATDYTFILEDGTKVVGKGNDLVEYEGDTYTVQNLYDAYKEGTYGTY